MKLKNNGYRLVQSRDLLWLLQIEDYVDRQIILYDDFESEQIDYFCHQVQEMGSCDAFFDVGANFGYYSLIFSQKNLAKKIISFEPDTHNQDHFRSHLFLNAHHIRAPIELKKEAVSSQSGLIPFLPAQRNHKGQSRQVNTSIADASVVKVSCVALDDLYSFSNHKIALKIDVEGYELDVLSGAQNLLKNNNAIVQIESFPENRDRVISFMTGLGYKIIECFEHDIIFKKAE